MRHLAIIPMVTLLGCTSKLSEIPKMQVEISEVRKEVVAIRGCWNHQNNMLGCFQPSCPEYMCATDPEMSVSNSPNIRVVFKAPVKPSSQVFTLVREIEPYKYSYVSQGVVEKDGIIKVGRVEPGNYGIRVSTEWHTYGEIEYEFGFRILP